MQELNIKTLCSYTVHFSAENSNSMPVQTQYLFQHGFSLSPSYSVHS